MHRLTFTLVLAAAVGLSPAARAQETTDSARLYKEGWRLYQDKQYDEACPLLERSVAASATIVNRGALALCYEAAGRNASAYRAWQGVVEQARAAGPSEAQRGKRAAQKLEQLRPKLTMVLFQVVDSPADTQVSLDGKPLPASELGAAMALDPGTHSVEARAAERVDWRSTFELGKGDEGQTRSFPIGPLQKIAPITTVTPPATPQVTPTTTAPRDSARKPSSTLKWVGIGAAGAGVVALGVGTVFGLSAKSKWDDAKSAGCTDAGVCPNRAAADLVDSARSKATLSTVTVIAGAGLVAGGTLLWLFAPREKARVAPDLAVGPGAATVGVKGAF